jgi:hypothetical protein
LVWRKRKKISKIIKDYSYLPFFLLIILWEKPILDPRSRSKRHRIPDPRSATLNASKQVHESKCKQNASKHAAAANLAMETELLLNTAGTLHFRTLYCCVQKRN